MIDKIHRILFISSLSIMGLFLVLLVACRLFFYDHKNAASIQTLLRWLAFITPFTPIGMLFGTLKEEQTTRKKLTILFLIGLSVLFLLVVIWGTAIASTFD